MMLRNRSPRVRYLVVAAALLACATPARAQFRSLANLDRINGRLCGRIDDYTHNHGSDRRICSRILDMPRDCYVYVPPGYTPSQSYPMILYMHMGYVDEHALLDLPMVEGLDRLIASGQIPPVVLVCPDGTYSGENRYRTPHSMFVNGCGGRVEDFLLQELLPFVLARYSIRPEREAHALLGASAGGFGALSIALRHRDYFGVVATLSPPANVRYFTCDGNYRADFDPRTYRWRNSYDPNDVVATFYLGLRRVRARSYVEPVFDCGDDVTRLITQVNPADLIFSTDLRPGQLAIYINYAERDNYNFDAQAESFAWLAAQRGVAVTLDRAPGAKHNLPYFRSNYGRAFCWLGRHLPPPAEMAR